MLKKLVAVCCCLLLFVALAGCSKQLMPKSPIKIGINIWPGYAHAFVAQEKGFFKKNGVEVKLVLKKEQSENRALYAAGLVDGFFGVFADVISDNARGIPSKVAYVVDYSEEGDVIIARSDYKTLADLKGKVVSFEELNGFSHLFVLESLQNAGLSEADVRFKLVYAHQVLDALEKGEIDAGHTWEPTKSAALKKGYHIVAKAKDVPGLITDVLAFSPQIIQERPAGIKAIVKSLLEAEAFIRSNKEEAVKMMSRAENMNPVELEAGLSGINMLDLKENLEALSSSSSSIYNSGKDIVKMLAERGQLDEIPRLEDMIDPRFIQELSQGK